MMQNTKENLIKLLNKIIEQDQHLLTYCEINNDEYVEEISYYRFIINLLQDEEYFNIIADIYRLETEEEV